MEQNTTELIIRIQERFIKYSKKCDDIVAYGNIANRLINKIKRYISEEVYDIIDYIKLGICARVYL